MIDGPRPDISIGADGLVHFGDEGMSTSRNPFDMESHRKPPEFGGTATGQQMWCINMCDLGPDLQYVSKGTDAHPTHGVIVPARSMTITAYQNALANTRNFWKLVEAR